MSSAIKRSRPPLSSGPSKRQRLTSTTVVQGDCSNSRKVHIEPVNGDPFSITPHDVYKAAIEVLGESNSYDLSELQVQTDRDPKIVVATVREGAFEREERATKRKKMLSNMLDE